MMSSDTPGATTDPDASPPWSHTKGWPPALDKARVDTFEYAAFVVHLGIVTFSSACDAGDGWVTLTVESIGDDWNKNLPFSFDRGVDVRLDDIRWVADAPNGS